MKVAVIFTKLVFVVASDRDCLAKQHFFSLFELLITKCKTVNKKNV